MIATRPRARRLAPALLAAWLALNLGACGRPAGDARLAARQAALDAPQLWQADALDAVGRAQATVLVCTDQRMRQGFVRSGAELNGAPCLTFGEAVVRPGLWSSRCTVDGRHYAITLTSAGDPDRELAVRFAFKGLDAPGPTAVQARRYRRLGACPAGWKIGDQARPGRSRSVNSLQAG